MTDFFKDKLSIAQSIIATLSWFGMMERPLTYPELKTYLWRNKVEGTNLHETLDTLLFKKQIVSIEKNNTIYYSLTDDLNQTKKYFTRHEIHKHLINKAKKISYLLRFIPFLNKIYICNSLAIGKANKKSDIDFFVITEKGMMFLTRLLLTIPISIFGYRRHDNEIEQKICLSFFTEVDNANLEKIAIENDIYLIYWIATLQLLYGSNKINSIRKTNKWLFAYLPNLRNSTEESIFKIPFLISWIIQFGIEAILRITFIAHISNKIFGFFQKRRALKKLIKLGTESSNIVSNNMLKFHNNDKRKEYRDIWFQKINKFQ